MKKLKRFTAVVLALCFIATCFSVQASAFGGYAHWYMGHYIASLSNQSANAKLAYKSGCLLADIGKATWDSRYNYDSDSYNMALSMFLLVDVYPEEFDDYAKYMYYGWRDHYHQDEYGKISYTNPPYDSSSFLFYRYSCGWVDEYLRDELADIDYPIRNNEIGEMYIDYELISRAYDLLCGFAPTESQIKTQIKLMFAAYDFQIALNYKGWDADDAENIINELRRSKDYCYGFSNEAPDYMWNSRSVNAINNTSSEEQTVDLLTEDELKTLASYIDIKETRISETASYLKINVNDKDSYNFCVRNMAMEKIAVVNK